MHLQWDCAMTAASLDTPWLQTRSGRAFPLLDPVPLDVHWPDIIFALSHINRFGGHVGVYSVAQHSLLVANQLRPEWRVYGLLHDAHEAFLGDIPTPLKKLLDDENERTVSWLARGMDRAIFQAADCCYPVPEEIMEAVHIADRRALMTERRDLMEHPPAYSWGAEYEEVKPLSERIIRWSPEQTIRAFSAALARCGLTVPSIFFIG